MALTSAIPNFIVLNNSVDMWATFPDTSQTTAYYADGNAHTAPGYANFPTGWNGYTYAIGSTAAGRGRRSLIDGVNWHFCVLCRLRQRDGDLEYPEFPGDQR